MINYFRKIRKKMADDNRPLQYMRYAIGEIILVVIGILIALSINNWNEKRKENLKEQAILIRLKKEFMSNRDQLLDKIQFRNGVIESCERLLKYYNEPENATLDSIVFYASAIAPSTFDPIQNDLVSSGNIEILKNEELKQLIINWSTDVIQLREVEQVFLRHYEQTIVPYLTEIGISRDIAYTFWKHVSTILLESRQVKNPIPGKSKLIKKTKNELLADPKLEGIVAMTLNLNMFNNQEAETLIRRINYILQVLDSQIKK